MYEVYGVIGDPVSHSLSPIMHNLAFKEKNVKAVYGAFKVRPSDLAKAVEGIRALNIKGVSVTIPHKEKIIEYLDEIDEIAQEIGAVNTILNKEGILKGFNTDWIGVLKAFEENGVKLKDKKVVVIGAGGASKAVIYALIKGGAKKIYVYNRTFEKAKLLEKKFKITAKPWEELKKADGDIIIQATSVGLKSWETPVGEEIISRFKVAMDIVYLPLKTKFLSLAERYGKIIDGLQMLLYQGVEQFKIWTGMEPPLELMKKAIYEEAKNLEKEILK
ncbi:MAG: shikimate dehydrogenase [Thermodesulfobacterium geofontis]|uniref:Shikimate dehydrogenase (NADP(+)) n=1 Tax=Thermodesulfobacterium geofontis TaxID=1295609 RepID=A0A2N7PNF6_9BACT|nr:MAG: shikimate dehydrogenase [Thermodesulfobacterium geofontis]PMP93805.1 MAG: shikimate dehydrogenase [Thermodesulfobacterium geofontis]